MPMESPDMNYQGCQWCRDKSGHWRSNVVRA